MEEDEDYDEVINDKSIIIIKLFKIISILIMLLFIFKLREKNIIDIEETNSKVYIDLKNKTSKIFNITNNNSKELLNIKISDKRDSMNNSSNIINISTYQVENYINNDHLIKIIEYINYHSKYYSLVFPKITYFNITYINYILSPKFNRTKLEYNIGLFDEEKKLNTPSDLTLYHDITFLCFICIPELNITIYSIANNYENQYINCKEYFNLGENITFGIKIFSNKYKQNITINFFSENITNSNILNKTNDSLFDPDIINQEFKILYEEIYKDNITKTYYLKKEYLRSPNFDLRRSNFSEESRWDFNNFYNDYFCYCVGKDCFDKNIPQECKYLFFMTIIEKYKHLYPKTEYIFADFIFNYLSSDDVYPIFQEMIKQNYPAHYITQNKNFFLKYCGDDKNCQSIIPVNVNKYLNYGDTVEKYLTLILKTKAFITCRSTDYHKIGFLLYKTGYVTYITVGHGVCFFKDYLFSNGRIYGPDMNDKVLIPPSVPLISIALKFGWKLENIIKINLPKWDKYDGINKEIIENYINNITNNSILIMFTYRMTRIAWNLNMSKYYFENITKLIFNERLKKELKENNITLYYSMHRMVNPGYQKKYKETLDSHDFVKLLPSSALSECLSKTNLVITDFSSILFDLMYRDKPFIIYLPDADDPLVDELYTPDYIDLIHRMNNRKFNITNICNNVEETVDKIIFYIKNKFVIDTELKKFFDYIGIKHNGSNIQKFIDYLIKI